MRIPVVDDGMMIKGGAGLRIPEALIALGFGGGAPLFSPPWKAAEESGLIHRRREAGIVAGFPAVHSRALHYPEC